MRTNAGLHADQTRRQISQTGFDLAARPLLPQHNGATSIQTDDVERVLANIDADDGDRIAESLRHGVLLVWLPLASLSLAGKEHGRTIPLTDIAIETAFFCTTTFLSAETRISSAAGT